MNIGKNIKKIRELNNYKLKNVATVLDMSVAAYGRMERNETEISVKRLQQIAEVLNTTTETLLNFDNEKYIVEIKKINNVVYVSAKKNEYGDLLQAIKELNENINLFKEIIIKMKNNA